MTKALGNTIRAPFCFFTPHAATGNGMTFSLANLDRGAVCSVG